MIRLLTQMNTFHNANLNKDLLVGLGVAYVISGDFAAWNFGLAQGGWGGMFIATILVAIMYLCLCLSMSEMSSMMPTAGGGYSFARLAF